MRLPNGDRAIVDIRKLQAYCLDPHHPRGRHKARVFASVGIFDSDASELSAALLQAAATAEAHPGLVDSYGERYVIDFDVARQGRTVRVRSSWIVLAGQDVPRLTTCYVL